MIRNTTLILFIATLTGCAALGTKTLYKSDTKSSIKRVGFSKLDGDTIVSKLFSQTDSIFNKTFIETFKTSNVIDAVAINNEFSINNPDQV